MSHHSLQQWDHYKRQMDQLMARPDFLTNLAQSAGAMSALVNNMLDPSVSDWSAATASGKPLLTSQEQVKFKEMLDPYVPYIRAFFKGEPLPHSGEQHGGAEDLVKKMQQKLTQNMTYMGQYNVIMYGGEGPRIDILGQKERNANRETKDVMVYPEPPINVPLRFITTSIVMLFDVIRMISSLVGWEKGAEILSVVVSALEVSRGEWKRGITSFMGYFGTKSLWIGQVFKVFVYMFQTIPTAMNHALLDDVTEMGRTIIFGMVLNIFQTIAPADIRQVFIKNIDTINENNALLTKFFNNSERKQKYQFDPTNPKYAIYFNQYSWGDLTELQSYMIEARCTKEMSEFHDKLEEALKKEEAKEHASYIPPPQPNAIPDPNAQPKPPPISATGIVRALLRIMGMLSTTNCKETPPLIAHVIKLITGKNNNNVEQLKSEFEAFKGILPAKKAKSNNASPSPSLSPSPISTMLSSAFAKVAKTVQNTTEAVRGKVGPLMPKQSKYREKLEQLQKEFANREEYLTLLPQIQELDGKIKNLDGKIKTKEAELNPGQKGALSVSSKSTGQTVNNQDSLGILSQPQQSNAEKKLSDPFNAMSKSFNSKQPPPPSVASLSSDPFPTSGGRRTHRNTHRNSHSRRIRASTRALRQRARE